MTKHVRRLFASFQPKQYELTLDPDRDTTKITGTVVIKGQKTGRPSQRLTFHQKGLKITSAEVIRHDKKGDQTRAVKRINHQQTMEEVRLHCDAMLYPGAYTVTMEFEGVVQAGNTGAYFSDFKLGEETKRVVSTQFESHFARMCFPCIDEPEAKATFDLTLFSPKGEAVLANMPPRTQSEENGKLKTVFETTPKMSTYLLAFAFGDFQSKQAKTKSGVEIGIWATKAHTEASLDFALDVAKRTLEYFEDYYGVPYPLPKCDHIAIPDFASAAMENWGLITYREFALLVDPETSPQSSRELVGEVIAHEVSHQWFGDLVTMKWWDDLWLNESFANVMAFIAEDKLFPKWKMLDNYIASDGLAAIRRDSIAGVQSIKMQVHHPDEISTIFDPSIVYAKGGRLINTLVEYLGKDDFRKGMKTYFETHAYGNTTGDDLWAALSKASGKDVAAFMNPWLERSGMPVVKVKQSGKQLTVSQSHFLLDPKKADGSRVWPVPLLSDDAGVPGLLEKVSVDASLPSAEYVRINKGATGHYVVQYVNPEHAKAVAGLAEAKKLSPAERLMLLSDSSMLARAGQQSFVDTLQLLEHYSQENSEPVWDIIALILADSRRFIDIDETLEGPIKALVRELIAPEFKRLGWQEKPGEPTQDTKLRATIIGLGVYAEDKALVDHALKLFESYKKDPGSVPAELRAIVFGAAVRQHAPGAFQYLLALEEKTQNVDLKQELLGALTLTRREDEAKTLLGRVKDGKKVRQHDVDHWVVLLLRNRYAREQSWKWIRDNWGWIEKTFSKDPHYDSWPRYVASAFSTVKHLGEYQAFFEPLKNQVSLARNIAMGVEEIGNRAAWLERDVTAVKAYFKTGK